MPSPRISAIQHFFCGLAIGAADAVPGISGGTVALILGIYRRLVEAISQVNLEAFRLLRERQWRSLAQRFDAGFLAMLLAGILCGLLTFISIMHELIGEPDHPAATRPFVYAIFFGAIAGSSYLVARMIHTTGRRHTQVCIAGAMVGALFAWWLTGLPALEAFSTAPNPLVSFLLGAIAISAMILPGISGSYLLLIFGAYHYYSGIPKNLAKGHIFWPDIWTAACFAVGCLVGLLTFSKILKWLLREHEAITLAVMGGFMIGALRKLWPWQGDEIEPPLSYEPALCILLMIAAAITVIVIDLIARPKIKE